MVVDIKKIKKIDNQTTYAIGYRNLWNIVVMGVGFSMAVVLAGPAEQFLTGLVIFVIGTSNAWQQIRDNIDTIAIAEEMNKAEEKKE